MSQELIPHIDYAGVHKRHTSTYLMHKYWARNPYNMVSDYIKHYSKKGEIWCVGLDLKFNPPYGTTDDDGRVRRLTSEWGGPFTVYGVYTRFRYYTYPISCSRKKEERKGRYHAVNKIVCMCQIVYTLQSKHNQIQSFLEYRKLEKRLVRKFETEMDR